MSDFVPASTKELYQKMFGWNNLRGKISYDEETENMTWIIANDLRLEISLWGFEGMVNVFDSDLPKTTALTHWHPDADEVYREMLDINESKIKFAYIDTVFGKQIVYIGIPTAKKKYRFRLIRFLGE